MNQETNIMVAIVPAIITGLVTIGGFIINYFVTMKNFDKQINGRKAENYITELAPIPFELMMFQEYLKSGENSKDVTKKLVELYTKIFAYGSEDAIKILASMQQYNYNLSKDVSDVVSKVKPLAYLVLLACQIRFDSTGLEINPAYWYKIKLNDYYTGSISNDFLVATNDIVEELNLSEFLKIN